MVRSFGNGPTQSIIGGACHDLPVLHLNGGAHTCLLQPCLHPLGACMVWACTVCCLLWLGTAVGDCCCWRLPAAAYGVCASSKYLPRSCAAPCVAAVDRTLLCGRAQVRFVVSRCGHAGGGCCLGVTWVLPGGRVHDCMPFLSLLSQPVSPRGGLSAQCVHTPHLSSTPYYDDEALMRPPVSFGKSGLVTRATQPGLFSVIQQHSIG